MSLFSQRTSNRQAIPAQFGAREINVFSGSAANDNGPGGPTSARKRFGGWGLPLAAFASGLTAALIVSGLGDLLGVG